MVINKKKTIKDLITKFKLIIFSSFFKIIWKKNMNSVIKLNISNLPIELLKSIEMKIVLNAKYALKIKSGK